MAISIKGQVYQVGGSVRDALLDLPVSDQDFVVVGATMQDLLDQGFQEVGKGFPVFLHPETHDEYALARTERKTGPGHRGFAVSFGPEVTLEDDLARRDLTINAMAMGEDGSLVDPYGGEQDLRDGVLRHVSDAFADDPLRVLRVARFAARFGFSVHPETLALMRRLHDGGDTHNLSSKRVWKETSRALTEEHGSRYWTVLQSVGLGRHLLPLMPGWAVDRDAGFRSDAAALDQDLHDHDADLSSRVARWSLPHDPLLVRTDDAVANMWREAGASGEVIDRVTMTQEFWRRMGLTTAEQRTTPSAFWRDLALRFDVLRRPQRWFDAIDDVRAHGVFTGQPMSWLPDRATLRRWVDVLKVDAGAIAKAGPANTVQARVQAAREAAWEQMAQGTEPRTGAALAPTEALVLDESGLAAGMLPFEPRRRPLKR